ncbi:cupredoxin domain-containing protein [Candidatus Kaiserbacteria bacterium]|nr:cupredoxin domain-containing protein [Candidatus Kaiserbacteria bacterium]
MKSITIAAIIAIVLIGGAFLLTQRGVPQETTSADTVSVVGGKQIIEIKAKGGYSPEKSVAKAGIPTVLRFETDGTFDCSSAVRIPSMGIERNLPPSGATDIELGNPALGTLEGSCSMGMYPFEIEFQG